MNSKSSSKLNKKKNGEMKVVKKSIWEEDLSR